MRRISTPNPLLRSSSVGAVSWLLNEQRYAGANDVCLYLCACCLDVSVFTTQKLEIVPLSMYLIVMKVPRGEIAIPMAVAK